MYCLFWDRDKRPYMKTQFGKCTCECRNNHNGPHCHWLYFKQFFGQAFISLHLGIIASKFSEHSHLQHLDKTINHRCNLGKLTSTTALFSLGKYTHTCAPFPYATAINSTIKLRDIKVNVILILDKLDFFFDGR